jgi:hypothetical protein
VFIAIDNREKTHGSSTKSFFEHLQRHKCPCETRQLDLGDFIWVGKTQSGEEVVLDTIVERKQISDLVASFKDRRYKGLFVACLSLPTVIVNQVPDGFLPKKRLQSKSFVLRNQESKT